MRFVRENLFYVILVAVVVVGAALAWFYYTSSGIDKNVKDRTSVSNKIKDLAGSNLKVNQKAVDKMQERIDALAKANKEDLQNCLEFNRRNLPVMKIPIGAASDVRADPFDASRYRNQALTIKFIVKYNQELDQMVAMPELKATVPPTPEQVAAEIAKLTDKFKDENPAEVQDKAYRSATLIQASAGLIYVDRAALDPVLDVHATGASMDKLWEAQVNLWVTREILQAIGTANARWIQQQRKDSGLNIPESVTRSAVRQLLKMEITENFGTPGGAGALAKTALSRRDTSMQYAVVPYRFVVVMPTEHIRLLTEVLESQNYHTVNNISLAPMQLTGREGIYYGIEPVMKVQFDGELLLLADWVRDVMPADMAQKFGKTGS